MVAEKWPNVELNHDGDRIATILPRWRQNWSLGSIWSLVAKMCNNVP